jgi:hypothetical protein
MSPTQLWWQQYGLTALLSIAACAGLVTVGVETGWGRNLRSVGAPERGSAVATELTPTLPAFKLGELDAAFKESGERPLFTPTRRPPVPALTAATPHMKRGQFKLAGTVVNAETSVAYLVEIAGNKTRRVNKGAEVLGHAGLRVDSVESNRVVLKLGDETETLELRTASSPAIPQALPTAVTPPGAVPTGASAPLAQTLPGPPPQQPQIPQIRVPVPALANPAPGAAVLPGFVAGAPGAMAPGVAEQSQQSDPNQAAQRRRRFQNPGQQPPN